MDFGDVLSLLYLVMSMNGTAIILVMLTALPLVAHICASLYIELRDRLLTFPICVPSQRLIARLEMFVSSSAPIVAFHIFTQLVA